MTSSTITTATGRAAALAIRVQLDRGAERVRGGAAALLFGAAGPGGAVRARFGGWTRGFPLRRLLIGSTVPTRALIERI
ncbi:MAG: hypothetical protein ACXVZ1_10175 [Gaiellaceae bacterium]